MAVIGRIRKRSGLIVIVVGIALAAFVLGDLLRNNPRRKNYVGVINDEKVSYIEFSKKVDEAIEMQKQNKQKDQLSQDEIFRARQNTWDQIVYKTIMGEEFDKLGLVVTSDELFELVQGNHPHPFIQQYFVDPETGGYNPALVLNYLRNLNQMEQAQINQWLNFEKAIKQDQLRTKYNTLVSRGLYMPRTFSEMKYQQSETEALTRIILKRYQEVPDSLITVSEEEIEKKYEEVKHNYIQNDAVTFDYVVFDVKPSREDHQKVRENVDEIYQEFRETKNIPTFVRATSDTPYDSTWKTIGELPLAIDSIMFNSPAGTFVSPYLEENTYHMAKLIDITYRPDSMKASHILITYQGAYRAPQNINRSKEEAENLADSLYNLAKNDPERIESLAMDFSEDPSARENSGDLGWFPDQTMVHQFNETIVNNDVGDVEMVETPFGYHVIRITGKSPKVKKVKVAIIDREIKPSSKTYQEVYTNASIFAGENNTEEKFEKAVTKQGLVKKSAPRITKMTNVVPGLDNPRNIIRWAFSDNTEIGDVSPVFDLGEEYVIAVLKSRYEKGLRPLDELYNTVKNMVINDKKAQYIISESKTHSGNIYQLAEYLNTKVDTVNVTFASPNIRGIGREPKVVGTIFTLEEGKLSEPVQGNLGVYWVIVDKYLEPSGTTNYGPYIQEYISEFQRRVGNNNVYAAIKENADITDYRLDYY